MFKSYEDMLAQLEREMRRISDDMLLQMFRLQGAGGEVWAPRVDIYETKDKLVVKVCAAGIKPAQVDISLSADDRFLTVRGHRTEGSADRRGAVRYYQLEVYYGPFERVIGLPVDIDIDREKMHATYKDGFLIITLPKKHGTDSTNVPIMDST
jgi:HSP20 family protein